MRTDVSPTCQSTDSVERVTQASHTDVRTYERTEKWLAVDESLAVVTARAVAIIASEVEL